MKRKKRAAIAAGLALIGALVIGSYQKDVSAKGPVIYLTNVSYDPTRELYEDYNRIFAEHRREETGENIEVIQSHGGSAKQALEVANGLGADVVTLALEPDIDAIAGEGLIEENWKEELPKDSAPYTSTIVFLVRRGNPKQIYDWDDLIRPDVGVITPNPKTSGGARWNYLAAWAYAKQKNGDDEAANEDFMKKLYQNVVVLDAGARGATSSFVENGQGDVLIAWENEAYLTLRDSADYEIVTPSISVLAQPSVAVVDGVAKKHGTTELAQDYLSYLYSEEAQEIVAKYYYRPTDERILKKYADVFDLDTTLVSISDFGGWEKVMKEHFNDGGIFDRIYE